MADKLKKIAKHYTLPAVIVLLAGFLFFSPKFGFVSLIGLYHRHRTVQREIKEIDARIILLQNEIYRLKHDDEHIEKVIREELGMIKRGEKILKQ